jgi:Flp pilus assembly protein TadD
MWTKFVSILLASQLSCAGGGKSSKDAVSGNDGSEGKGDGGSSSDSASSDDSQQSSGSGAKRFGTTMVTSLNNSGLTSRRVNREAAKSLAAQEAKSRSDIETSLFAERLAITGLAGVLAKAKLVVTDELKKGVDRDISDQLKLELAIAAIQSKNAGFARLYLNQLVSSTNPKIKAGALNAQGVMALSLGDVPEAALLFKEALKASSNYPAALFNLGFVNLKFGDFEAAKGYLEPLGDDWYSQSGILVAVRNLGDNSRAEGICSRLLPQHGNNKTILFNCGLFFAQNKGDKAKARELVTKAVKISGGLDQWDDVAYKLLEKLGT